MAILLDTQAIVWAVTDNPRLSVPALDAITDGKEQVFISAVTAYEFTDLNRRGRFDADLPFADVVLQLEATLLDYPASLWTIADGLPGIHLDPVDRMLVAHAIHTGLTLVTADAKIREYPVRTLW